MYICSFIVFFFLARNYHLHFVIYLFFYLATCQYVRYLYELKLLTLLPFLLMTAEYFAVELNIPLLMDI